MAPYLHILYNSILSTGEYPIEWSKAIICPLHKKGSTNNPDNYRGISLLSVLSKVFNKILLDRFTKWLYINYLIQEEQAGYKKGILQ